MIPGAVLVLVGLLLVVLYGALKTGKLADEVAPPPPPPEPVTPPGEFQYPPPAFPDLVDRSALPSFRSHLERIDEAVQLSRRRLRELPGPFPADHHTEIAERLLKNAGMRGELEEPHSGWERDS